MKKIFIIVFLAIMSLSLFSCTKKTERGEEILVSVYAAGYGTGWIDEACRIYEENHPGVTFRIEANSRMFDTVATRLSAGTCDSDIILLAYYDYETYANKGDLEDLTEVYTRTIPGTDKTVYDMVDKSEYNYRVINDKIYGIPWQDSGPSGIIYNKKMFEQYGWEIPNTMDEFFDLCDQIATDTNGSVAPIVYGGGQQSGYAQNTPTTWIMQYYGYDYMANTFQKYESPAIYQETSEGRTLAYKTLARMLKGQTTDKNTQEKRNIYLRGSNSLTAQNAQKNFIQGKAAMDICGVWFPTEMSSFLDSYSSTFEAGFMPLPHINSTGLSINGEESKDITTASISNVLCIPTNALHKDVAKDFLVSMLTEESYATFVNENNGLLRPFNIEISSESEAKFDNFTKEVYEAGISSKKNGHMLYMNSTAPMFKNGYLAVQLNTDLALDIINAKSYEDALAIAEDAPQAEYNRALSFWDSSKDKWKEIYLREGL